MIVGVTRIEILIPHAQSLKEKRKVVKGLIGKIRHRFNVSVSEVDGHDLWQRADIGIAHTAKVKTDVEQLLRQVESFSEGVTGAEIIRTHRAYYDPDTD